MCVHTHIFTLHLDLYTYICSTETFTKLLLSVPTELLLELISYLNNHNTNFHTLSNIGNNSIRKSFYNLQDI